MAAASLDVKVEPDLGAVIAVALESREGTSDLGEGWTNAELPVRAIVIGATGHVALGAAKVVKGHSAQGPLTENRSGVECGDALYACVLHERSPPFQDRPLSCECPHSEVAEGDDKVRLHHLDLGEERSIPFMHLAGAVLVTEERVLGADLLLRPGEEGGELIARRPDLDHVGSVTFRAHDPCLMQHTI